MFQTLNNLKKKIKNFTINPRPHHPAAHCVLRLILDLNGEEEFFRVGLFAESAILKKHLGFVTILSAILVCWLFVCAAHYFVEFSNRTNRKFAYSKRLEDVWCFVLSPLFFFLVFSVVVSYNGGMQVVLLEEASFSLEGIPSSEAVGDESILNPLRNANLETIDKSVLAEIEQIMLYFKREGYTARQIFNTLYRFPDSFWSLGYWEKIAVIEASLHMQEEEEVVRQGSQIISFSVALLLVLMLIERFAGV